ncbi:MAG: hypothetical protein IJ410_05955 [Oscillospiraceae bacterium]|nr:hypothetical protein [Oscillospiraceae bacterium]
MILKEVAQLRRDMAQAVDRIAALEDANALLAARANSRAETTDAQATYTAMMTDTLLEV